MRWSLSLTLEIPVQALQRLTEAAEKAKMELSQLTQTSISLPFITATAEGPKHIEQSISRAKFEDMCGDLLDRCRVPVERALKDANLNLNEMNEVILVGGSTRIPAVQVCFLNLNSNAVTARFQLSNPCNIALIFAKCMAAI